MLRTAACLARIGAGGNWAYRANPLLAKALQLRFSKAW